MTSFTQAIEKLIRRIQRAFLKGKDNKVDRLTEKLNKLIKLQEHAEESVEESLESSPPSSESSESEEEEVVSEEELEEELEEESLPSGNGDAPENEGGEDTSEEGIINDGPNEDDYFANKTDGNEFRY